jgi:hypothetical protein
MASLDPLDLPSMFRTEDMATLATRERYDSSLDSAVCSSHDHCVAC